MSSTARISEKILLLCFRATGHYWPLAFRQLALPVGFEGESFPYRRPFVFSNVNEGIQWDRGLICMKYDAKDSTYGKSAYIPLRWVRNCERSGNQENLITFNFQMDATIPYPAVSMEGNTSVVAETHSELIKDAVKEALREAGGSLDDDDHALCIAIGPAAIDRQLSTSKDGEGDRWVNLTRLLSSGFLPLSNRFPADLTFARLNNVKFLDVPGHLPFVEPERQYRFHVGRDVELEVLTVRYFRPEKRLKLRLNVNPDEIVTVLPAAQIHFGTWIHRFVVTPRKITDYTLLSFRFDDEEASSLCTDFSVHAAVQPLVRMPVIDGSNPNKIRATLPILEGDKKWPVPDDYLLARTELEGADVLAVVRVESTETSPALMQREYILRLIGIDHKGKAIIWDGAALGELSTPKIIEIDLEADVEGRLKRLMETSDPGGRCELIRANGSGPSFDLRYKTGFKNVHTAVFGQTGSGKSYSVGVLIEELLGADFKILVLDPNSDFINFGDPHSKRATYPEDAYRSRGSERFEKFAKKICVYTNRKSSPAAIKPYWHECKLAFSELDLRQQAGLIHLDRDQIDLYSEHRKVWQQMKGQSYGPKEFREKLETSAELSPKSARRRLAALYANYELEEMGIWSTDGETVISRLGAFYDNDDRMMVIDLGSLKTHDTRLVVAGNVLNFVWGLSQSNPKPQPLIIVVDEAHNLVSPNPVSELHAVTTEILNRIAAEGRKYGLYLMLMTQRPSKLHPNCLGMVSNLICMKVTNREDLHTIQTVFGNIPDSLFDRIRYLGKGQALVSGNAVPFPCYVRFGRRFADEGIKEP
jgi:hypothetical protein